MARFDVDLIEGTLRDLCTRLVVPLGAYSTTQNEAAKRLCPLISFQDTNYVLNTSELAAIPVARLSPAVGSIVRQRDDIIDAIDFLMQGF